MGPSEVEECEAVAAFAYERVGLDPSKPVATGLLCELLYETRPERVVGLPCRGLMSWLDGRVHISVGADLTRERARETAAHELSHAIIGRRHDDENCRLEAQCDTLGACLLAPAPAVLLLIEKYEHSVYDIARALHVTQAMALLRIGEVTGRPVKLLGARERTRGRTIEWPCPLESLRGLHRGRVHPVKLADEGRWGLMAG